MSEKMISLLLAEDHVMVREALRAKIEEQPDFKVVSEAGDGREAVRLAMELKPDVVIMDVSMPNLNGVEAARQIASQDKGVKVLALSMHMDRAFVTEMLQAGAAGFLVKHCTFSEMAMAIRAVAAGQHYLSPSIARIVVNGLTRQMGGSGPSAYTVLTPREREVLQLLAEGKSTKEVAVHLNVSVSTVETHRRQLKNKLHIDSLAGLVKYALKEGLTSLET